MVNSGRAVIGTITTVGGRTIRVYTCPTCGVSYNLLPGRHGPRGRFCSTDCAVRYAVQRRGADG